MNMLSEINKCEETYRKVFQTNHAEVQGSNEERVKSKDYFPLLLIHLQLL